MTGHTPSGEMERVAEVKAELTAVIAGQQRLLGDVLKAIDTGSPNVLAVVREQLSSFLAEHGIREVPAAALDVRATPGEGAYLVWSNEHQAWWGRDHRGYTRIISRAGRYTRSEALSIAGTCDGGWRLNKGNPDEIAIPEQDALDQYAEVTLEQMKLATPDADHAGGEKSHG